jgi:hypothetical protein
MAAPSNSAIVVASATNNSILEYAPGANGNAAPANVIQGTHTGINNPSFAAFDPDGNVVVTNMGTNSVTEYVPGSNGDATPVRTIIGTHTGLSTPAAVGFDASGRMYVFNAGAQESVTEYAPGANGDAIPVATISGATTRLLNANGGGAMVVSSSGEVLVADGSGNRLLGFAPGASGNVAPSLDIEGSNTLLGTPTGVAVDPSGNVYASNQNNSVTEYAAGASGNVAPIARIIGTNTQLNLPSDLTVDPNSGDVIVVNNASSTVTEYAPGSTGNVAPTAVIAGSATGLTNPQGVSSGSPILITQAPADQSVLVGGNAEFVAAGSGTPTPTVQWQVSTGGGAFTDIPGATSTTLDLTAVTADQDGSQYRAVFTSSVGSAKTAPAQLTVIGNPTIQIGAPASGASYTYGSVPAADFGCTAGAHDTLSSCTATIDGSASVAEGGALAGSLGDHTLTVTAVDAQGGTATRSVGYTVEKAPVHVDANSATTTYGTAPTLGYTLRQSDFQNGDTASVVSGSASCAESPAQTAAGAYSGDIVCDPGTLTADNYTFVTGSHGDLTINSAVVHVDANSATTTYGTAPTLGYTLRQSDFQSGDTASVVSGSASCAESPPETAVGVYPGDIVCDPGTLTAANYTFASGAHGDLTINAAFKANGFYAPIGAANSVFTSGSAGLPNAQSSTIWNTVKSGSTVPLKFNVYKGNSEVTTTAAFSSATPFTLASVACPSSAATSDPVDFTTTGDTGLRYDTSGGQWVQNWQTPSNKTGTCWRVSVTFADGAALSAFFKLK